MRCPKCEFKNPEGIKYCGGCGEQLTNQCPKCGFSNPTEFKFCGQCKCSLFSQPPRTKNEQKFQSERKYVTVMFSDLAGYTAMTESFDPEEVRSILENVFKKISTIIETFGGFIERYIGDSVMVVFGIPKTHEDDPIRALQAAIKIHKAVNSMNTWVEKKLGRRICMHTGINTGLVLTGAEGSENGSHGLTGLDLNIASRIEGIAQDDEIIVGHRTYLLTKKKYDFKELQPVTVKGKQGSIRIFRLVSPKNTSTQIDSSPLKTVFVGREKEVEILHHALNQVVNTGTGNIISITGEPGIGKSALLEEYKKQLSTFNLLILQSQSSSISRKTSYGTFLDILKDYAEIKHTDDNIKSWDKLESKLTQLAPDEVVNTLPYLATILSIQVKTDLNKRIQFLDAKAMKSQVFRAFYLFIEYLVKQQPLILVFEDFHWSDESTIELLIHLFPLLQKTPFQILFICRGTIDNPLIKLEKHITISLKEYYQRIELKALPKECVIEMAVKILDLNTISSQLSGLIHRKSEGNPLYLEELIRVLLDNDLLEKNQATGQYTLKPISGKIQIPDTLRGLVSSSVDRLDKNLKNVLKNASVIGRNFLYRLLELIEDQKGVLDDNLSVLIDQNLIKEKTIDPELEYYFYHDLVKDAIYETILIKERKKLHLKIAEAIEHLFQDQIEKFYSLLSYHYAKASDWNKATKYFSLSGDQASKIAGDSEALAHYKKAITAHEELFDSQLDDFEKASYTRKVGEIYFRRGENDKALESFKQAFELLDIRYPFDRWRTRTGIIKLLCRQMIRRLFFYRVQTNRTSKNDKKTKEIYEIFESMVWIDFFINQERLFYDVLTALNYAEKKKDPTEMIKAYSGFALLLDTLAFYRFAQIYHNLSEKLLHHTKDDSALATFYVCKAIHFDYTGSWDQAIEYYKQAEDLYKNIGHLRKWGSPKSLRTFIYNARGDFDSVNEHARDLIKIGMESGDRQLKGWGYGAKAIFNLRMGYVDKAIDNLIDSKALLESIPDYYALVMTHIDLMNAYIRIKKFNDAYYSIKNAENLIQQKNLKGFILSVFQNAISDFYLRVQEGSDQINVETSIGMVKKYVAPTIRLGRKYSCGLPGAYRVTGKYYWLKGRYNKARKYWEEGIKKTKEFSARYEEGLICYEMGKCLRNETSLSKAKNLFEEINSKYEISLLKELTDF